MTDETGAPAGGEAVSDLPADAPAEFSSITEAANYFSSLTEKRAKEPAAESAEVATAEPELSGEDNAAPPEEATGETEEADPAAKPPLELPRSWTKEQADHWKALPRETQEFLTTQASKSSEEVRRVQNEAAEERKAAQAERSQAEQARQKYEAERLAPLDKVAILEYEQRQKFPDIKSMADLQRIAAQGAALWQTDPVLAGQVQSYLKEWDIHQSALASAVAEKREIEGRTAQEKQSKRAAYETEQNKLLIEMVPDMADPKKAAEKRDRAVAMLTDELGLKMDTLQRWMQDDIGHEILSNAGIQKLIADRLTLKDIQGAKTAIAAKPLPPVLRPGNSRPAGADASEREQALTRKPELDIKEATELYALQSRRRRA